MATNFYKQGGSYYVSGTGKKISNTAELKSLSNAGGKEVPAPTTSNNSGSGQMATLYGPNGQKQQVPVGSELAKALQSSGWGLTAGSYKMVGETETPETDADKVSRDEAYKYIDSSAFDADTKILLKKIADQQYKSDKVQYTPAELDKIISDATLTATDNLDPYYKLTTGQTVQDLQNKMADIRNTSARYTQQEQKSYAEKLDDTRSKLRASGLTFSGANRKTLGAEGAMDSMGVEGSVPQQRRYDIEDTMAGIQQTARDTGIAAERKLGSGTISNIQSSFGTISNPYNGGTTYNPNQQKNLYEANQAGTTNYVTSGTIPLERLKAIEEAKNARVKSLYL